MENQNLSRKYLETLTNQELIVIADDYGLDIPENLNRRFIIEEIIESVEELENAAESDKGVNFTNEEIPVEPTLPASYNETKIRAIIRDPAWIYAFWDISKTDEERLEQLGNFKSMELHLSFFDTEYDEVPSETLEVKITKEDRSRYILLSSPKKFFVLTLEAVSAEHSNQLLAYTKRISVPERSSTISEMVPGKQIETSPLVKLSGIESILRHQYLNHREFFTDN